MAIQPRHGYLPTLDGWRAIAILAVLCSHTRWPIPWVVRISQYGAMGVHLFFALSGFLITWWLIQENARFGKIDWTDFYVRRVFRILPGAFVYLSVIAVAGFAFHLIPISGLQLAGSAFFFRNYLVAPTPEPWYTEHFWSLSVEEHFYLLWPLLLYAAGFRRARFLAPMLVIAVALWRVLDGRYNWVARLDPALKGNLGRTDYRLDILFCGCAVALLWNQAVFQRTRQRIAGTWFVAAILVATAACLYWKPPGYFTMLAILMALLPAATVARPDSWIGRVLEAPALRWIGRISYSLYLWQELFLPVFGVQPTLGWIQVFPQNLLAAFCVAGLSYYLVERPAIAYGRRIRTARLKTEMPDLAIRR
ncbi:MAG: acyltransferase [Bryobacteraceae bacterium]